MIPEIERKAVLNLFPYFNRDGATVVDVGSNKGDWSETLVHNVVEMHLYEPNEILRHYSQVRFRALKNVHYWSTAISSHRGSAPFYFFEDEHDGLSNIIGNRKWNYLNPKYRTVVTVPLDDEFMGREVDLLKIDVEGAELWVLLGSIKLLEQKLIKFIEVECAEHIQATGKTFQDIVDLVTFYGYDVFHFDGERFLKWSGQSAENLYIMDANFSQNWNLEFIENTRGMKCDFVLEIGAFEGLTSKYICENILKPGGRMICVDPLTDEYLPGHKDNAMFVGQYDRFIRNTANLPVELIRKKSFDAFAELFHYRFDLIYIDGDHTLDAVYNDAVNAFRLLRVGGYLLFDDYDGYDEGTKRGIDRFLNELPIEKYSVLRQGYQLLIGKHENLE